jgi:hypothetical protein
MLFADLQDGVPALAEAVRRHSEAPWCPLVLLVSDPRITRDMLAIFEPWPGCVATLPSWESRQLPPGPRLLHAVRNRPLPTLGTIALYIEGRLHASVGQVVQACVGDIAAMEERSGAALRRQERGLVRSGELRARRTLSRRVRALGAFEVREWRGLARLGRCLAAAGRRPLTSLEAAAWETGVDPRTLRRWIAHFTGLDWGEFRTRGGWEWVVEMALRRAGYLGDPPVVLRRKAS